MSFDWQQFLDSHSIEYVTEGHNARRYVIGIKCPFCGDDPSHHMGISTRGKGFNCWRNGSHKGKAPQRLIMALLHCSFLEADQLVRSDNSFVTTEETFAEDVFRQLGQVSQVSQVSQPAALEPLPEFRPVDYSMMSRTLIYPYLINERRYRERDVSKLADRFDLMFATKGRYTYRLIIPVYMNRKLVNWTGRSIVKGEELRYKSMSTDLEKASREGLPPALINIKETLFDYDNILRGGETLVVCEGPLDAMRLSFFGERYGIRATALFSKTPTPIQLDLLRGVADRYDEVFSAMDADALDTALLFPDDLHLRNLSWPREFKDPAEFTIEGFERVFNIG